MELKKKVTRLTEIARSSERPPQMNARPGRDRDNADNGTDMIRQVQMAMAMNDMESRMREREMLQQAMRAAVHDAHADEDRLLQAVLEESK